MNNTCARCRALIDQPQAGAKGPDLEAVLDHLDACSDCQQYAQERGAPEALWAALADLDPTREAELLDQLAERRDAQAQIANAIDEVVLPSVSRQVRRAWADCDSLGVARGLQAVATMVFNLDDPDRPRQLVMNRRAEILADGDLVIDRASIEHDVRLSTATSLSGRVGGQPAGVLTPSALQQFLSALPLAARSVSWLLYGVESHPKGKDDVLLDPCDVPDSVDLVTYWRVGAERDRLRAPPLPGRFAAVPVGGPAARASSGPSIVGVPAALASPGPTIGGGAPAALPRNLEGGPDPVLPAIKKPRF